MTAKPRRRASVASLSTVDYEALNATLIERLRKRDRDPRYADAQVFDVYARISRKYTAHDDEKTDRQVYHCLLYIEAHGLRLGEVLVDEARSAWKEEGVRPAWLALLARVKEKACNGIVCRMTDRLMRQPFDLEVLIKVGTKVHGARGFVVASTSKDHSLDRADDLLELRNRTNYANYESAIKSKRLRDLNADRRAAGDNVNGGAPFGHRFYEDEVSDVQLAAERDALARAIRSLVDGASCGDVAKDWNGRGLATRGGHRWHNVNVRKAVLNPRHAGLIFYNDVEVGPLADAEDVRVVPEELWRDLVARFSGRKRGRQAGESEHWLSGILRCDACGTGMSGGYRAGTYPEDGAPKRGYRCPPQACKRATIDARAAEKWAEHEIGAALSSPDHAAQMTRRNEALSKVESEIEPLVKTADDILAKIEGVHESRRAKYMTEVARIEAKLRPLLDRRDDLRNAARRTKATSADVKQLRSEINAGSPAKLRQLAKAALPDGFYCAPVGRDRAYSMRDPKTIQLRFSIKRGEASSRFTA